MRFPVGKPLPAALVKLLVRARLAEFAHKPRAKKPAPKKPAPKKPAPKKSAPKKSATKKPAP